MTSQTETTTPEASGEAGGQVGRVVVLPLAVARIIRNVFLPRNPNKLRGAHPDTVAAAKVCIAAIEEADWQHNLVISASDLLQEKR